MFPGTHAVTAPERPAVIMADSGRVLTYQQLDDNSARLAAALYGMGLRKGDVIALLSDNSAEAFEIYWAAIRSGLYITAVNWHLAAEEAAYIVEDSGAQVVLASSGVRELAERLLDLVSGVRQWYSFGGVITGYQPYVDLLSTTTARLTEQPRGAEMLYSSGTTGRPKGIKPHLLPIQVDQPGIRLSGCWRTPSRFPVTTYTFLPRRFITPPR